MRGAPCAPVAGAANPGIIPADAGSTIPLRENVFRVADHPRGCGEHFPRLL